MTGTSIDPHAFVIVGATGDLSRRKLLPALARMWRDRQVDRSSFLLGCALTEQNDDGYRDRVRSALSSAGLEAEQLDHWIRHNVYYEPVLSQDYSRLADRLASLERKHAVPGNRAIHLAVPPDTLSEVIDGIESSGIHPGGGWTRLVVEKPFGHDLASATGLNRRLLEVFDESEIFRIDHYLGKETVQNILSFRFANPLFESWWSRERVANVQITIGESVGVASRGAFYDGTGALRDMIQNHGLQLLGLVAMDCPTSMDSRGIATEKLRLFRAVKPVHGDHAILGQYRDGQIGGETVQGFRNEDAVADDSETETFAALRIQVDNWRWHGVPFLLRTGKRLPRKVTEIALVLRDPPTCLFQTQGSCEVHANVVRLRLQPDEAVSLLFDVKVPGDSFELRQVPLDFSYSNAFRSLPDAYDRLILDLLRDAYDRLILDLLRGDATLFVSSEEIEATWSVLAPVLQNTPSVETYPAGSWGPDAAEKLAAGCATRWITG